MFLRDNLSYLLLIWLYHKCHLWITLLPIRGRYFYRPYPPVSWFKKNLVFLILYILVLLFHCSFPIIFFVPDWIRVGSVVVTIGIINQLMVHVTLFWYISLFIPIYSPALFVSQFCLLQIIIMTRVHIHPLAASIVGLKNP